jgi:hypothetical protein
VRTTRTYAVLEITPMAYAEIRGRLERAGYAEAIEDGEIDMHGIGLKIIGDAKPTNIEIGTLLSARTKAGVVELCVNGERTQMDLDKAREVLAMLSGAIEAAVSDQLLYQFLTKQVDMSEGTAAAALLDFREMRQGSRSTVYPQ